MGKSEELREKALRFLNDDPDKLKAVYEDEIDGLVDFAEAFDVVDKVLSYMENKPDCRFEELLELIPEGYAPGLTEEELLETDE